MFRRSKSFTLHSALPRTRRTRWVVGVALSMTLVMTGVVAGRESTTAAADPPPAPVLTWTTCPVTSCQAEAPEVAIAGNAVTMGQPVPAPTEGGTQNSARHTAAALLEPAGGYEITFKYDLSSWDTYTSPTAPGSGGHGYWDSFSLSVSPQPYWQLAITDPITTSNLPGLGFVWGGLAYGDAVRDDTGVVTQTVTVPGDNTGGATNYLNVTLDTASLPDANHAYPSYGTMEILNILPINPAQPLTLKADQEAVPASPGAVPVSAIPLQPNAANQVGSPLGDLNILGSGLGDLNILGSPLGDLNILGSPLGDLNILGSGLGDLNILGSPITSEVLGKVTAGDTPLRSGSWESLIFPGTRFVGVPAVNVTWRQLLTDPKPPAMASLTYADIDWSKSPLGTLSPIAVFLGHVRARDVILVTLAPLTSSQRWCSGFEAQGFANCGQGFGGLDASFLAMQLAGVDFTTFPVGSTPFSNVNAAKSNFINLPLLGDVNTRGVHSSVGLGNTPFGALRFSELTAASRAKVFDCAAANAAFCDPSLNDPSVAEAAARSPIAIRPTAKIVDLGTLSADGSTWTAPTRLGEVFTGQVLYSLLAPTDNPIEDINLDGLASFDGPATSVVDYHYSYTNTTGALLSAPVASATLPKSFLYVPNSATVTINSAPASAEPAVVATATATVLSWSVATALAPNETVKVDFQMRPGMLLGSFASSASITDGVAPVRQAGGEPVTVVERFEPNGTAPAADGTGGNATPIDAGIVYFSHIGLPQDTDYFKFPIGTMAPGTRVRFSLSHLSHDADLVVYSPASAAGSQSPSGSGLGDLNILGSPLGDLNILGSPVPGQTPGLNDRARTVLPEVQQDIPLLAGRSVAAISSHRGLENDFVDVVVPQGIPSGEFYLAQVSGYLNSASNAPYALRAKVANSAPQPACPARTFPFPTQGAASNITPNVTLSTKTLFLLNQQRLGKVYGTTRAAAVTSALQQPSFLNRPDIMGQIVPLDGGPIDAAYQASDASPCAEQKSNDVVKAIKAYVRTVLPASGASALENIVIVGTDTIAPHFRVQDLTDIVNERTYAGNLAFTTTPTQNNSTYSSVADGFILTDNPYGDFNPIPFGGQDLHLPDLAVGRLGETPEHITGQISRFIQYDGTLDPSAVAYTAAYDFMKDMGSQVLGILGSTGRVDDTWTAAQIKSEIFNKPTPPKIISVNGHADHSRMLAGAGNAAADVSDTVSTQDVLNGSQLTRAAIFGMGCHYGLSVEDFLVGLPTADSLDWSQAYAQKEAASFAANTGYGYGDRFVVAYSERLMVLFAKNLKASMTSGQALRVAKQIYFSELGSYSEYDRKVLEELTGWGLPQWKLPGAFTPPANTNVTPAVDPSTGLQAFTLPSVNPNHVRTNTAAGSYFQDGTTPPQITVNRPPTARSERDITPVPGSGLAPRGFFVTGANVATVSNFDPVLSIPDFDQASNQREPRLDDVNFPGALGTVNPFLGATGTRYKLNLLTSGFQASGYSGLNVIGINRNLSNVGVQVFYANVNEPDRTPARFVRVEGFVTGAAAPYTAHFDITLDDETPADSTDIKAVQALVFDGTLLKSVRLARVGSTDRWQGSTSVTSKSLRFSACAVDNHANTSCTKHKGNDFGDNVPPAITISAPVAGATFQVNAQVAAAYSCSDDSGSPASCDGTVPTGAYIDTATPGYHVFAVTASDEANNVVVKQAVYYVNFGQFIGFGAPVSGTDSSTAPFNTANSGQAIPLKWQVKDKNGQNYPGLTDNDVMILWKSISCNGSRTETLLVDDPTALLVDFKLKYNAATGDYLIVVKTPKDSWAGTCRRLTLTMAGVETHFADFKFK